MHVTQSVCPHCNRSLTAVEKVTGDHVVPRTLGGSRTVPACKRCNDCLGGGIEARVVGPTGWLTILSQAYGLTKGQLHGTGEREQPMHAHFEEGLIEPTKPEHQVVTEDEGHIELMFSGPNPPNPALHDYMQNVIRPYGGIATRAQQPAPVELFKFRTVGNIADLRRLTAKIALTTGAMEWGDDFLATPLADWLRVVLDVRKDWKEEPGAPLQAEHAGGTWTMTQADLEWMTNQAEATLGPVLAAAGSGQKPLLPPPIPLTMFVPVNGSTPTHVLVRVLGVWLPVLVAPHPLLPHTSAHVTMHPGPWTLGATFNPNQGG